MLLLVIAVVFVRQRSLGEVLVHDAGKVYRSGYVSEELFRQSLGRYGVRTFVMLCTDEEKQAAERLTWRYRVAVRDVGGKFIDLPFPSADSWHVKEWPYRKLERLLRDPASYPVWVCSANGKDRAIKAMVVYDVQQRGMTARDSLLAMPEAEHHAWPVIAFAHTYQSWHEMQLAAARQQNEPPSPVTASTRAAARTSAATQQ